MAPTRALEANFSTFISNLLRNRADGAAFKKYQQQIKNLTNEELNTILDGCSGDDKYQRFVGFLALSPNLANKKWMKEVLFPVVHNEQVLQGTRLSQSPARLSLDAAVQALGDLDSTTPGYLGHATVVLLAYAGSPQATEVVNLEGGAQVHALHSTSALLKALSTHKKLVSARNDLLETGELSVESHATNLIRMLVVEGKLPVMEFMATIAKTLFRHYLPRVLKLLFDYAPLGSIAYVQHLNDDDYKLALTNFPDRRAAKDRRRSWNPWTSEPSYASLECVVGFLFRTNVCVDLDTMRALLVLAPYEAILNQFKARIFQNFPVLDAATYKVSMVRLYNSFVHRKNRDPVEPCREIHETIYGRGPTLRTFFDAIFPPGDNARLIQYVNDCCGIIRNGKFVWNRSAAARAGKYRNGLPRRISDLLLTTIADKESEINKKNTELTQKDVELRKKDERIAEMRLESMDKDFTIATQAMELQALRAAQSVPSSAATTATNSSVFPSPLSLDMPEGQ